jgi:DNA-binding NarL/FixJ family response regulator
MDGLTALRAITDAALPTRVVVVTTFEIDQYVFEALAAGASGFVLKDSPPAELIRAVRVVADGAALLSPAVTRRVVTQFARRSHAAPVPGLSTLTAREREVVAWVSTGGSNAEIALELYLSPATVRTHVSRAMVKLGARSRAQLVVFALRAGLTP